MNCPFRPNCLKTPPQMWVNCNRTRHTSAFLYFHSCVDIAVCVPFFFFCFESHFDPVWPVKRFKTKDLVLAHRLSPTLFYLVTTHLNFFFLIYSGDPYHYQVIHTYFFFFFPHLDLQSYALLCPRHVSLT